MTPPVVDTLAAEALWREGATFLEVLPPTAYGLQHIPGARNIPLPELTLDAAADLPKDQPIVVYCWDTQCDLSSRGAARLIQLGFPDVRDYVASKAAWMAAGLPIEGTDDSKLHAADLAEPDVPTCGIDATAGEVHEVVGDWPVCVVLDDDRVVLGVVRADAAGVDGATPVTSLLLPGPPTVRPSIPADELLESMEEDGQDHVLVSTYDGVLLGLVTREQLRAH